MADTEKKAFIHRLARKKRPPAPEPQFEPLVVQPVTGESVAAELRRAREDLGRDLFRIADDLKIRRVYLQAIEDGRFDDLPGATYAVGFVRAYAEYLGLDSVAVVGRFKEEVDGLNERLQLVFPTPVPESKIPSGAIVLISILLVVLAYGGWYYLSSQDADLGGQVLDLPDTLEPLVSGDGQEPVDDPMASTRSIILEPEPSVSGGRAAEPPNPGVAETPDQAPDQASAGTTQRSPAPSGQGNAVSADLTAAPTADRSLDDILAEAPTASSAAANSQTIASTPLAAATGGVIPAAPTPEALLPGDENREPRVYGVENNDARIVLRARLDSWVQVHAADESLIMTRVLQPGDSYRVPNQAGLTLVTGNAGGLEIEVDGAVVPALGPVGAIRRGIALDPERLLKGTAGAQ
jgi:cytoskeleton protein RodZ